MEHKEQYEGTVAKRLIERLSHINGQLTAENEELKLRLDDMEKAFYEKFKDDKEA